MSKTLAVVLALAVGMASGILLGGRLMPSREEAATATPSTSFGAVPDAIGAQDISGPYEVVEGWPKDLSTLPGHEKWTFGAARGVFAESPNHRHRAHDGGAGLSHGDAAAERESAHRGWQRRGLRHAEHNRAPPGATRASPRRC